MIDNALDIARHGRGIHGAKDISDEVSVIRHVMTTVSAHEARTTFMRSCSGRAPTGIAPLMEA